jgi:hypothetical protein
MNCEEFNEESIEEQTELELEKLYLKKTKKKIVKQINLLSIIN